MKRSSVVLLTALLLLGCTDAVPVVPLRWRRGHPLETFVVTVNRGRCFISLDVTLTGRNGSDRGVIPSRADYVVLYVPAGRYQLTGELVVKVPPYTRPVTDSVTVPGGTTLTACP